MHFAKGWERWKLLELLPLLRILRVWEHRSIAGKLSGAFLKTRSHQHHQPSQKDIPAVCMFSEFPTQRILKGNSLTICHEDLKRRPDMDLQLCEGSAVRADSPLFHVANSCRFVACSFPSLVNSITSRRNEQFSTFWEPQHGFQHGLGKPEPAAMGGYPFVHLY